MDYPFDPIAMAIITPNPLEADIMAGKKMKEILANEKNGLYAKYGINRSDIFFDFFYRIGRVIEKIIFIIGIIVLPLILLGSVIITLYHFFMYGC